MTDRTRRTSIALALDIRSTETVNVLCEKGCDFEYPEGWLTYEVPYVPRLEYDQHGCSVSVVIIDRVDLLRRELAELIVQGPRILAMCVADLEQEKKFRKNLRTLYPWAEVWETHTDFGKVLMTTAYGQPYDRESVVDMRPHAAA